MADKHFNSLMPLSFQNPSSRRGFCELRYSIFFLSYIL